MDYEIAAMQAANRIFPNAQLFGCLFHLTRNIKRHLSTVPGRRTTTTRSLRCIAVR